VHLGKEDASEDIVALVDAIISEALRERRISAGSDTKSERLKIVSQLERKGVFLVKGVVELISGRLNISKFTLYSYLDEIRSGDDAAYIYGSLKPVRRL
jgi:predicted transcriptional regulator YheO